MEKKIKQGSYQNIKGWGNWKCAVEVCYNCYGIWCMNSRSESFCKIYSVLMEVVVSIAGFFFFSFLWEIGHTYSAIMFVGFTCNNCFANLYNWIDCCILFNCVRLCRMRRHKPVWETWSLSWILRLLNCRTVLLHFTLYPVVDIDPPGGLLYNKGKACLYQ